MFSTEKTKQYWYLSIHSLTLAKSLIVNSFPFLSTFVKCTTLDRLDLGIVLICRELRDVTDVGLIFRVALNFFLRVAAD